MSLYLALALCAFLASLLVYRYDLYNREAWYMLVLTAFLGAAMMRLVGHLESAALSYVSSAAGIAAVAAAFEETARLVLVAAIAVVFRRHFDDPMDGIVYGSIAGLGMGLEESFHLLSPVAPWSVLTFPVELVRLLGHLVLGGIACFGLGRLRAGTRAWPRALVLPLLVASSLHFLWDWLAIGVSDGLPSASHSTGAILVMLAGLLYYGRLVVEGAERSRQVFSPARPRKLWGWPFDVWVAPDKSCSRRP